MLLFHANGSPSDVPRDEKAAQQNETANGSEAVIVGNKNYYFYFIVTIHPKTISDHFIWLSTKE